MVPEEGPPDSLAELISRRMDANPALRARGVVTRLRSGLMDLINQVLKNKTYKNRAIKRILGLEGTRKKVENIYILEGDTSATANLVRLYRGEVNLLPGIDSIGYVVPHTIVEVAFDDAHLGFCFIEDKKGVEGIDSYLHSGDVVTPMRAGFQLLQDKRKLRPFLKKKGLSLKKHPRFEYFTWPMYGKIFGQS
jgi:hypothetical protein